MDVDLLSVAGHKLYAPKGVGALYIRRGLELEKQIHGANHEMGRRAGTENVIEIVGLGEACAMVHESLDIYSGHMRNMRDRLETGLKEAFPIIRINGHPEKRLPNTSSIGFKDLPANIILSAIADIAASPGAACHSDHTDISSVLKAMRVPMEYALGTIRFSVGRFTTAEEIDKALHSISEAVRELQAQKAS
jgi:cysteine desulfurase